MFPSRRAILVVTATASPRSSSGPIRSCSTRTTTASPTASSGTWRRPAPSPTRPKPPTPAATCRAPASPIPPARRGAPASSALLEAEVEVSYENDLDFYRYPHPCPGEDCNLRVVYELDGGPVDFVFSVYRESALWFGGITGPRSERESQPALSGSYGGTSACLYAFAGHQGDPYNYYLAVRDLADVRDWDADQRYRFCIERTSRGCEAPCVVYDNGCGAP